MKYLVIAAALLLVGCTHFPPYTENEIIEIELREERTGINESTIKLFEKRF